MLHPVGPLRSAVYWRRRLLVFVGVVGVLGGGGWLGVAATTGASGQPGTVTAGATTAAPASPPALEQVLPSLAAVSLPTPAAAGATAGSVPPGAVPAGASAPAAAAPVSGGPCSDAMLAVTVRPDPASAPAGSKPTFVLVVTDTSPVACVRPLDKGLQEVVLADAAGNRVWGSNDCYPEASSDTRTLQPGVAVQFPVVWSGLGSTPGCAGQRSAPPAGTYVLRARLDTATSPSTAFTLT